MIKMGDRGVSRRTVLATGSMVGATLSAGCLDWLWPGSGGSDDDSESEAETDQQDDRAPENDSPAEQNGTGTENESSPGEDAQSNETGDESAEEEEEGDLEVHNESELHPDEEETRHQGEYNESASGQQRETAPRPRSDVEITDEAAVVNDRGGVTMTATITNTSRESIDVVQLYVDYSVRGEFVYGDSTSVTELAAGASKEATSTAPASRVGGANPDGLGVEIVDVLVYDYASSGS